MRAVIVRSFCAALLGLGALNAPAPAQLIPVRTVPVASGDQFLMLPGRSVSMGSVALALDDTLADPWSNPARGAALAEASFFGAPTFYRISDDNGAGNTLPVGVLIPGDRWFGGGALAIQQVSNESRPGAVFIDPLVQWTAPRRLSDASARNLFARGFLGRRPVASGGWAWGVGLGTARLRAMDGVDLLYAGATDIRQSGSLTDVTFGLSREGVRDRLDLTLVHSRVDMTHDVAYLDWAWDSTTQMPVVTPRVEKNEDRTRTWAGQVGYVRALETPGWRVGASLTVNRKSHPKIPNYEIQNIPRDPGTTWAYDLGFGFARTRDATTVALDVHLQPIFSDTWQEADAPIHTAGGGTIPVGGRTIENEFLFANVHVAAGLEHRWPALTARAGVAVRSYDYELDQQDHVQGTFREQEESWMEWTPSAGVRLALGDVQVDYTLRATTGTGRPGVAFDEEVLVALDAAADFIAAPRAPLTLQDATVWTHQVAIVVPVR